MKERLIYFFVILVSSLLAISSCESYAVGRNIDIKKELSNNNGIEQGEFNSNVDNKNNQKIDDNKIVKNNRIIQNVPVEADNNYKISSSSGKNSMPVLENLNKNKYEIKNVIDEEGNIKTEVYHNNELFQETPQRDRPRDNDPIDDRNRNYFDINIVLNEDDEWVRDERVTVLLYYDENFNSLTTYRFEENHRIIIPENFLINGINDNFDVIIYVNNFNQQEMEGIIMLKPLLERQRMITFDLSDADIIRTNVNELNEEKGTNSILIDWGVKESGRGILGTSFINFDHEARIDVLERGYIANNIINDWNFLVAYYLAPVSYQANIEINNLALTKDDITYPFERVYEFNNENLRNLRFNIKNSFYADVICFSPIIGITFRVEPPGKWLDCLNGDKIPKETLPREINLFFSENNFYDFIIVMYHKDNITDDGYNYAYNNLYQYINFERYYNEHENIDILNAIEKPNSLRLYYNSEDDYAPYFIGYLSNGLGIGNYFSPSIPADFVWTNNLDKGRINIITPNQDTYSSTGGNFMIQCFEGVVVGSKIFGNSFQGMECIEGNYIINWSFTNIIKNRNIYLDAVVHYNGEEWTIVQQNSRKVDRGGGRPLEPRELG